MKKRENNYKCVLENSGTNGKKEETKPHVAPTSAGDSH